MRVIFIYALGCFSIYGVGVDVRAVRAIFSVRCVVFSIMGWTVQEVRQKIKEHYSEEVAEKFEGEFLELFC